MHSAYSSRMAMMPWLNSFLLGLIPVWSSIPPAKSDGRSRLPDVLSFQHSPAARLRCCMPSRAEYENTIRKLKWAGLNALWEDIIKEKVDSWWEKGKAFEYLIVRMFQLDNADVTWPYTVNLFGGPAKEEIDGSVRFGGLHWLIESKDQSEDIAIDPIAKLRNQLLRRPWGTIGLVFTTTKFTPPAVLMTHFALPQAILLWTGNEVAYALARRQICKYASEKYRACVEHGVVDLDITVL